jgi:CTP-dependent riboflavin kinase
MAEQLRGKVESGQGNASHWLRLFSDAYQCKLGMPVYPGSLNVALDGAFDWFAEKYQPHVVWFRGDEYGGQRDILLLPCRLANLQGHRAFLWSTTTAARNRPDPWVVEVVCDVKLRECYQLGDGDLVEIQVPTT